MNVISALVVVTGAGASAEARDLKPEERVLESRLKTVNPPAVLQVEAVDLKDGDAILDDKNRRLVKAEGATITTTCYWRLDRTAATPAGPITGSSYALAVAATAVTKRPAAALVVARSSRHGTATATTTRRAKAIHYINFSVSSKSRGSTSVRIYVKPRYAGYVKLRSKRHPYGISSASASISGYGRIRDLSTSTTLSSRKAFGRSASITDGLGMNQTWKNEWVPTTNVAAYVRKGKPHRYEFQTTATTRANSATGAGASAEIDFGGYYVDYPNAYEWGRVNLPTRLKVVFKNDYGKVTC